MTMATVMTVRGPVPADQLGLTLPHEHLFIDLVGVFAGVFDFQLLDEELAIEEARRFKAAGGGCIVEVTTDRRMGRQPAALRRVAEALDLHIVMGCGWYREPWFEPEFGRRPTQELVEGLVHEIEHGADGTSIRPGIIGEIGADKDFVSPAEERALRASARAHHRSGLTITLHARASTVGAQQLDILEEEKVDPRRVIVGHCDTYPYPEYHEALARRGAWVQFDTIRGIHPYAAERRLRFVLEAARRGYLDQVLLSHDVCALSHLRAYRGTGYDYIPTEFIPRLREAGLSDEQIHLLTVVNPRRALTGEQ